MTIYADELFAVNFISNMLLLCAYTVIFRIKRRYMRIAGAAALGGIYAVCEAVFMIPVVLRAAVVVIMVFTAFGRYRLIVHTLRIMLLTVFAEGITIIAASITGAGAEMAAGRITVFAPELPLFIFYLLSYPCMLLAKRALKSNSIKRVYIRYNSREVSFNVLYDSGNLLKHRGKPVLIAEWQAVKELFSCKTYEEYNEKASDFVLYRTIGKNGAVPVFEPDICRIDGELKDISAAVVERGFARKYKGIIGSIS